MQYISEQQFGFIKELREVYGLSLQECLEIIEENG